MERTNKPVSPSLSQNNVLKFSIKDRIGYYPTALSYSEQAENTNNPAPSIPNGYNSLRITYGTFYQNTQRRKTLHPA